MSKKSIVCRILMLLIVFLSLVGCGYNGKQAIDNQGGYTVVDDQGYKLSLEVKPQRIVSYSLGIDEILLAIVPKNRILALTSYVDNPEISNGVEAAKEVKGRVEKNNLEQLLSLKPDLVIMPDFISQDKIQAVRDMGIKVYVFKVPGTVEEVEANIRKIGILVGEKDNAENLVKGMEDKLKIIQGKLGDIPTEKRLRVAFMGSTGVYYAPNSSFADVCKYAEVIDVTRGINSDQSFDLSPEEVLKLNPTTFVCAEWNYDGKHSVKEQLNTILSNPAFANIPGVKKDQIIVVPGKDILSISQYIVNGIEDLAKAAYPDKF